GHGQTSLGLPDGTLRQLGADLVALLDALGIERARVAGFSLGGTIAMRVAVDNPARVRGLVLVATSSRVGRAAADWYRQRVEMVAAGITGSRLEVISDAGHPIPVEKPRELARSITSFLND